MKLNEMAIADMMSAYILANTPSYLVQRFQELDTIRSIVGIRDNNGLLLDYLAAVKSPPKNMESTLWPFVVLMSFFIRSDVESLRRSTGVKPHEAYKFLEEFRDILLQKIQITTISNFVVPQMISSGVPRITDKNATFSQSTLDLS